MRKETMTEKTSSIAGYSSAAATTYFGLTLNEVGVIVGIATSVIMLLVNAYFQWKRDQREETAAKKLERRKNS